MKTRLQGAAVEVDRIRSRLLAWYARTARDLPWRRSKNPYRVWVSEIMLQQTQVDRVKEYFARFLAAFPDVESLAAAREDSVLRLWEGLGYYRRARQLHAAARALVAEHGGRFPRTAEGLRALPGIGRYTANAIASIAFDAPEPIVEANSRRVLARLAGYGRPLDGPAGDEPIWEIARRLVPRTAPGRFNQALMDLGAIVCTPARPRCSACPLAGCCAALRARRVDAIPAKAVPRTVKKIRETAVVLRHGDRVLVERRGPGAWWEGLWDFPCAVGGARGQPQGKKLGVVRYTVTQHAVARTVRVRRVVRRGAATVARRWVTVAGLADLAMTAPGRRIARLLKKPAAIC